MKPYDTIIVGGYIVDGTGSPGFHADLAISDGRVAEIGQLTHRAALNRIDAKGKIVAPGHITSHAHYDVAIFWDPFCSNGGENGVTTVVNGNCGFGIAPVRPHDQERTMAMLETTEQIPVSAQRAVLPWNWETFPEYLRSIEALPKGVNVLTFVPMNPVLVYVMGVDAAKSRSPTPTEMCMIHDLINEAMDAGAVGISMSTMGPDGNSHVDYDGTPMPTDSMDPDAMVEICTALARRGEGVIQLVSQVVLYGDRVITERIAEVVRGTGVRVLHNTIMPVDTLPTLAEEELAWLDGLRARGLDVVSTAHVSRGWIEAGIRELDTAFGQLPAVREIVACTSADEVLELIADPDFVARFAQQYSAAGPSSGAAGMEEQIVIDVGDAELAGFVGRTLKDIAAEVGCDVVHALLDLAVRSRLALQLKSPPLSTTSPERAAAILRHTGVLAGGSDGGAHTKAFGMGHYGTDLLVWLVRDEQLVSIEELHFKMSFEHARAVGLRDRGALLPGFWADILIYDLDALFVDTSRYDILHDMPEGDWRRKARAGGYDKILVNGVVTHENDTPLSATPGLLVRTTSDKAQLVGIAAE